MVKTAQWLGGPFDGSFERLPDDAQAFAVAFNDTQQRIFMRDLQEYVRDHHYQTKSKAIAEVKVIKIYPVTDAEDGTHILLYREFEAPEK